MIKLEIILAAIFVITTIGAAILLSEPTITLKPFCFSVKAWYKGAFYLLLMAIYITASIGWKEEYRKGFRAGISATIGYIIEQQNKQVSNEKDKHNNPLHCEDAEETESTLWGNNFDNQIRVNGDKHSHTLNV